MALYTCTQYSETPRLSQICQHDTEDSKPLIITRHRGIEGIVFSEDVLGAFFFFFYIVVMEGCVFF